MAPETVEALNPVTRERLHAMVAMDAQMRPSLLPVVPPHVPGMSAADMTDRLAAARWRDWLTAYIFPPDDLPEGGM